jgi:uncharacterized SAM-dependent methyltransferase
MGRTTVVKKLLYAVAIRAGKSPTLTNIEKLIEAADLMGTLTEDNIRSYIRRDKTAVPRPEGGQYKACQRIFNAMLGLSKEHQLANLDISWEDVKLSSELKAKVDHLLRLEESNRIVTTNNVLIAPDYHEIEPSDINAQIRAGALKAHSLYHSPRAAEVWDRITKSREYKLYGLCEAGLEALLGLSEWREISKSIRLVFVLGAGSPTKDSKILTALLKNPHHPAFVWVDASLQMLHKTIKQVPRDLTANKIQLAAIATDFENPGNLAKVLAGSFPTLPQFEEKKAFFILGFTLSNLNESEFFNSYHKMCSKGDVFIFPMQFIPENAKNSDAVRKAFASEVLACYNFDGGHKLAKSWADLIEDYKDPEYFDPKISKIFLGEHESLAVQFRAQLKGHDGAKREITTATSSRHYRSDFVNFLAGLGYELTCETKAREGVSTLVFTFNGEPAA